MLKLNLMHLLLMLHVIGSFSDAAERTQFMIGAIFPAKDEAEIAFQTAIDRGNVYGRNFEFVPLVQYADADDSFTMERTVCNLITQGAMAIFGPSTASGSDVVASICSTLGIPHLAYDWSPNEAIADHEHYEMTVNIHPDNLVLSRGIADLVQNFGWRSYTILYESDKELQQLQDTLQLSEPTSIPTTIRKLNDDDNRPLLKSIKMSTDNCLILHCSTDKILPILRQANELKILGEYQSIFIPNLETHTLNFEELHSVGANITTIRLIDPTDYMVKSVSHEWEERERREDRFYRADPEKIKSNMILISDALATLVKGLKELEMDEQFRAPKVDCRRNRQWPFGRRIIESVKERSEEASTGRIDFNNYGQRTFFTLHYIQLDATGFIELSTWNPVNGFELIDTEDDSDKRVGEKLSNKTFIITSRIGAPFLLNREPVDGETLQGNARYEGYSMDLIDAIAQLLNFKYEFQLAPDGRYGSFNKKTQQWDGLVKQLLDGNADLGICDLTMTSARREAVDFTPPFMTLGISILYSKPEISPPDLFSFLSPFSLDVWIYMASAYIAVSLLLIGIARMAPDDWENPHPCKEEPEELENLWGLMNSTWLTMGSIMGQGCDILPKAASTRLITGMWWFFALMMLNSYTANLAAFLTQSRMDNSIESAEDLAAQSKIKYGALTGGSTMGFFRDSNFSTYQRMWASMESARPSVFTKSNDEGVDRVLKGKGLYAFLMESTTLEYIVERQCELMQVGGWLDYKTYGIAMPFNSPFRKQISGAVLKLGESGTLAALKRKWWKEMHGGGRCSKTESSGGDTPELDLENVGGVFLVLGIGLFSAFLLGITEFLWNLKTIAIEEKITPLEAFKLEAMFALKFWITTKPVRTSSTKSSNSSSSSTSSASNSRSKRSSKSLGLSHSHSLKSIKSSANDDTHLSVHEKLRKIGSMFSIKSIRSEHSLHANANNVAKTAYDGGCDGATHMKIDKATQIEAQLQQRQHHHHHQHHQHHLENERERK